MKKESKFFTELAEALKQVIKDFAKSHILKNGPKSKPYCVYSKRTGKNFGCYKSRKDAEKRLINIEHQNYDNG